MRYRKKIKAFFKSPPRLNRMRFLLRIVAWYLLLIVLGLSLIKANEAFMPEPLRDNARTIIIACLSILSFRTLFYIISRLHDLNRSGWWVLIPAVFFKIPTFGLIVGCIALSLMLHVWPGTKGPNHFGPPQEPSIVTLKLRHTHRSIKRLWAHFLNPRRGRVNQLR